MASRGGGADLSAIRSKCSRCWRKLERTRAKSSRTIRAWKTQIGPSYASVFDANTAKRFGWRWSADFRVFFSPEGAKCNSPGHRPGILDQRGKLSPVGA